MKFYSLTDTNTKEYNIDKEAWLLYINYEGTPYEAFSDISFLTTEQAGILSENGIVLFTFEDEIAALTALSKIKGKEFREFYPEEPCKATATLLKDGILIDIVK